MSADEVMDLDHRLPDDETEEDMEEENEDDLEPCPRCGESAQLSWADQQGVVFHAPLCTACRDLTVREVLWDDFARLMGRLDAAEEA